MNSAGLCGAGCLILVAILIGGCAANESATGDRLLPASPDIVGREGSFEAWTAANPCGHFLVRKPLFNVSGDFTGDVLPNTSIFVFVSPNTTFHASLYVVENCAPVARGVLVGSRRFVLGSLPEGDYVVMVDGRSFVRGQGFPIPRPIKDSDYLLEVAFHGGTRSHSIAAFSIRPKSNRSKDTIAD